MITESELEAQAITWFQDTGWEFRHGPLIAPEGNMPDGHDCSQVLPSPGGRFATAESGNPCSLFLPVNDASVSCANSRRGLNFTVTAGRRVL